MNNEELKDLCLSFPHATEEAKGKDLFYTVGGKSFCSVAAKEAAGAISFKCTPERFADLVERDGVAPAPSVAKFHWVAVESRNALDADEYEDLISKSYLLVYENLPSADRRSLKKS